MDGDPAPPVAGSAAPASWSSRSPRPPDDRRRLGSSCRVRGRSARRAFDLRGCRPAPTDLLVGLRGDVRRSPNAAPCMRWSPAAWADRSESVRRGSRCCPTARCRLPSTPGREYAIGLTWWQAVIAGWAVVTLLGLGRVDGSAGCWSCWCRRGRGDRRVRRGDVLDPFGGRIAMPSFALAPSDRPALGLLLVAAALAFVGFETTAAYAEEARSTRGHLSDGARSRGPLRRSAWAMQVAVGPSVAATSAAHGPSLIFDLADARSAPWAVTLAEWCC